MKTIQKLMEIYQELKKYESLTFEDILRIIEAKTGVSEQTAKMYARMLMRHDYIFFDPETMMFRVRKEKKDEKNG